MQQHFFEAEENSRPFVGCKEPIATLAQEYSDSNPIFLAKIENLNKGYSHIRRIRRDGNCFYRAFFFGLLSNLIAGGLEASQARAASAERLEAKIKESLAYLTDSTRQGAYDPIAVEDFYQVVLEQVELAAQGKQTVEGLVESFADYSTTCSIVMYLRLLTAARLKRNADTFAPYILFDDAGQYSSIEQFCGREVEPMGKEADHCMIEALCGFFGGSQASPLLRILYLDLSAGDSCISHAFPSMDINEQTVGSGDVGGDVVTLLYRPGHYDVIYQRAE
eukprot:TRINITY_DN6318_c0_g1_i1.p1 TRINITY_DN6318_c0_g1~~TRINITY_DN6318_c0_g1_i1.p1  ORF type:complete len:294 (-),score=93.18 TRINITY_DN6318_c0_g1_i1:13-846(-)